MEEQVKNADIKAQSLERNKIIPYTLTNGFFKSNRLYPFYEVEVNYDGSFGNEGDVLLSLYSPDDDFHVVFPGFTLISTNKELKLFEEGMPLLCQTNTPIVHRSRPNIKVFAVFELYSKKARMDLITKTNYGRYRVRDSVGNEYINIPEYYAFFISKLVNPSIFIFNYPYKDNIWNGKSIDMLEQHGVFPIKYDEKPKK